MLWHETKGMGIYNRLSTHFEAKLIIISAPPTGVLQFHPLPQPRALRHMTLLLAKCRYFAVSFLRHVL